MANLTVKSFEEILQQFNTRLQEYGSQILNRQEGGAFDLLIRVECLQVADAYSLLEDEVPNLFPMTAVADWLDLHGEAVGLPREQPTKCLKEFTLKRDSDSGIVQIPVGDTIKTPVLPSRGQIRFVAIPNGEVDLVGTASSTDDSLIDSTTNFVDQGVKIGSYLFNQTDGSYGQITVVEENKLTVELKNGTNNKFTVGDSYRTRKPSPYAGEFSSRTDFAYPGSSGQNLLFGGYDFTALPYLQIGQKIYNVTDGSSGIIILIEPHHIKCDQLVGGVDNVWHEDDEFKLQTDFEIVISAEARFEGSEPNNLEIIIGRQGEAVECEADSGFTGVDHIFTTGEDIRSGADLEIDEDYRTRILNRWKELSRGSTAEAYMNFARSSSPSVFDANVQKGVGATDVKIILSGNPGSRNLSQAIGIKVDPNNNFDALYTNDGTAGGIPRVLGTTVHEYIRARAPMTDIIILSSVTEQPLNITVNIAIIEGFDFESVKAELQKRFRALFLVEKSVKDVKTIKVGETLLFSRLSKLVSGTPGVSDFNFIAPDPGTNFGDTTIDADKVFSMGTITIGEI